MSSRDVLDLIWLVPLFPLLGAALLGLFGKRIGEPFAGWIGSALLGLSFLWSVVTFFALHDLDVEHRAHVVNIFTWLPSGGLHVEMGFLVDPLSVTFILFVTGVATLIHVFSIGYMHGDERFGRFFAYMNLFVASMLVLVLGSSFLVTFLGWEGVGLCSYLLVGFWFERRGAATASKKAFITTRVGDVGFMIAMFLIFLELGSLDYGPTLANAGSVGSETATAIALLLFLGAIGKSAQFPLHVWLPDAMEGPTPVSALIHAATMVTAGVFLVVRAHAFFEVGSDALTVVAWIGAATALLAATVAVMQNDVKRVLAYSTISQLGYMFLAIGIGAYSAAIFHVITHAFFKAALFLGAGSVIHGNADNQDMRVMGGFRKYMPITAGVCVVAWLAISGVPPFSGFWSKDEILSKAFFADEYGLWIFGVVAALLTGFYMTRLIWMVFYGNERWRSNGTAPVIAGGADDEEAPDAAPADEPAPAGQQFAPEEPTVQFGEPPRAPQLGDHEPHESPPVMTAPLAVLGVLAAIGGIILIPLKGLQFLDDWLEPVLHGVAEIHPPSFAEGVVLTAISVIAGFVGIGIGVSLYRRGLPAPADDPVVERLGPLGRVFGHAYYFDEGIARFVDKPGRRFATLVDKFDHSVIDGAALGLGRLVTRAAGGVRRAQSGLVRNYALWTVVGVVALLVYVIVWAAR